MTRPLLDVRGLRVDYPGLIAVRALDLQIHAGEAVALIGPNGAGKTSTMRAICGLLEPTVGTIHIDGEDMLKQPERAKARIGFMPDFAPLYDLLTVYEFMEHYGGLYSVPNLTERIDQCLTMVELQGKRDARCKGLSRGMKQRLVLARTILPDPAVILLDEPASGLDPVSRRGFRNLVTQLRDQGKALLVSSHILSEIKEFSTHALVIEQGAVKVFGKVDDLAAQSKGARTYRTKWRTADDHVVGLLKASDGVADLKVEGSAATFVWHGGEEEADELLRTLVLAGVVIREWGPVESDLEHILLEAGATTVS